MEDRNCAVSKSLEIAKKFLGKIVTVKIDRPFGSCHPKFGFVYECNYGYIPKTKAPDGQELDAYLLGIDVVFKEIKAQCVAVIHRLKDDDDKLVLTPIDSPAISDEQIEAAVHFQEQWFEHEIIR